MNTTTSENHLSFDALLRQARADVDAAADEAPPAGSFARALYDEGAGATATAIIAAAAKARGGNPDLSR